MLILKMRSKDGQYTAPLRGPFEKVLFLERLAWKKDVPSAVMPGWLLYNWMAPQAMLKSGHGGKEQ